MDGGGTGALKRGEFTSERVDCFAWSGSAILLLYYWGREPGAIKLFASLLFSAGKDVKILRWWNALFFIIFLSSLWLCFSKERRGTDSELINFPGRLFYHINGKTPETLEEIYSQILRIFCIPTFYFTSKNIQPTLDRPRYSEFNYSLTVFF